ncbi:hypothetical protein [Tabrizicola sp.]|uniref:hypothetical protein n=1 Tax=Tabrizicola sp. TaxID=2005166 RepID=UPI00286B812B|nr:hypothetical protein [Tabrizicola sp.]
MQIIAAHLHLGVRDDAGTDALLTVDLTAPLATDQTLFPVTLSYDAIIHKVRSHRATVAVQDQAAGVRPLGEIGFDRSLRKATPLILIW